MQCLLLADAILNCANNEILNDYRHFAAKVFLQLWFVIVAGCESAISFNGNITTWVTFLVLKTGNQTEVFMSLLYNIIISR